MKQKMFRYYTETILSLVLISTLTKADIDLAGQVNHLEQIVADLQSQSKAQEQKYAAILSNVLSKLTKTTEDLSTLQRENNITRTRLEQLQLDNNATMDKLNVVQSELNISQFNLSLALKKLKCNKTDSSASLAYFEVIANKTNTTVQRNGRLKFDTVVFNKGDHYNESKGIFKAPTSGLYHFWAHVMSYDSTTFVVRLFKGSKWIVGGWTTGSANKLIGVINVMVEMKEGETAFFGVVPSTVTSSSTVYGNANSYYGGMLVHAY